MGVTRFSETCKVKQATNTSKVVDAEVSLDNNTKRHYNSIIEIRENYHRTSFKLLVLFTTGRLAPWN